MALFTPSESPAVVVKEIDLTGGVPNVQSTTGAIVGNFRWGPVDKVTTVSNETTLVDTFANPDSFNSIDFHTAAFFLRYSNSLKVVREATSDAVNSFVNTKQVFLGNPIKESTINNKEAFDAIGDSNYTFVGRFPGALGNSLKVSICPASATSSIFDAWSYASSFDAHPKTSAFAAALKDSTVLDELHIAVIDEDGEFTGTKNTVLETYPFVSQGANAKDASGSSIFAKDVINENSEYIYMFGMDSVATSFNSVITSSTSAMSGLAAATDYSFISGANSGTLTTSEFSTGHDLLEDKDIVELDFLIAPGMTTTAEQTTIVNDLVATAEARKDCVVVTSPARDDVVNVTSSASVTTNVTATADTFTKSSYLVVDGNYLKVYDKFNDQFIQIPAASSTAGLMAATDRDRAAWFSPAGARRGRYLGITSIDYTPTKAQRDTLYKAGVNPIANIPGSGIILFGDKTFLGRPSAFDRINVRRLFLILERAISRAAEQVLFEFNDEFTRAEFTNIIEPVLREVKGRRGITDFRVVCDATNNTAEVVDRNEFIANIFIKPARSINYVTLNFVAVRTGVDFEEVVGTV